MLCADVIIKVKRVLIFKMNTQLMLGIGATVGDCTLNVKIYNYIFSKESCQY